MTLVPVQNAAKYAERLLKIFDEIGAKQHRGVEAGILSLWEILDELAHPGDPRDSQVILRHVAGAGIHDLSVKICAVWDQLATMRQVITPHLKLLSETYYVGQNEANPRWDRIGPTSPRADVRYADGTR